MPCLILVHTTLGAPRAPKSLLILISSNFVKKNFPVVVKALSALGHFITLRTFSTLLLQS